MNGGFLGPVLSGLRARAWLSTLVLLVATVAVAVSAIGPLYGSAARRSILTDTLQASPVTAHGVDFNGGGYLKDAPSLWVRATKSARASSTSSLLRPGFRYLSASYDAGGAQVTLLASQGGCAHVTMRQGHCPREDNQMAVTATFAKQLHLQVGDALQDDPDRITGNVVGIYAPRDPTEDYWFGNGYFGASRGSDQSTRSAAPPDAVLTTLATLQKPQVNGTAGMIFLLRLHAVVPEREKALRHQLSRMEEDAITYSSRGIASASTVSELPDALDRADQTSQQIAVPLAVAVGQVLVLVALLLFLFLTSAMEARASEIALAKVRGLNRRQIWRFGLGEPVSLLLASLPLGMVLAYLVTRLLTRVRLRDDITVTLPWTAVLTAVLATVVGILAAVATMYRINRRGVLAEWSRRGTDPTRRGWVVDVALLVATGLALFQLYAGGSLGRAQGEQVASIAPGILGIGCAVIASRLLPVLARSMFGVTRRRGGLAMFLAVRQLARRPTGTRTMMVLTATWAMVAFTLASLSVVDRNAHAVAGVRVGAAAVATVVPRADEDLAATVDRLDPGGRDAMAVNTYSDPTVGGRDFVALDPSRWQHLTFWRHDFSVSTRKQLATGMRPSVPTPPPVALRGDRVRLRFTHVDIDQPVTVILTSAARKNTVLEPVQLGELTQHDVTFTGPLDGCPCQLRALGVEPKALFNTISGRFTLAQVSDHVGGRWQTVDAGLDKLGRWKFSGSISFGNAQKNKPVLHGLRFFFSRGAGDAIAWSPFSWPVPMPVVATRSAARILAIPSTQVLGLDGSPVPVEVSHVSLLPGFALQALMTDRTQATKLVTTLDRTVAQVWLSPRAEKSFPPRLRAAGVQVLGVDTLSDAEQRLLREGPAVALPLTLALALCAGFLAACASVAGLVVAARRRRFELAALIANGAPRRSLQAATIWEQAIGLVMSIVVGVGAGVLAMLVALPSVPEFAEKPEAPALIYTPHWWGVVWPLAVLALALVVAMLVATWRLVAGTRLETLREDAR